MMTALGIRAAKAIPRPGRYYVYRRDGEDRYTTVITRKLDPKELRKLNVLYVIRVAGNEKWRRTQLRDYWEGPYVRDFG